MPNVLQRLLILILLLNLVMNCNQTFAIAAATPARYFFSELPPYEQADSYRGARGIGIDAVKQLLLNSGFDPTFVLYSLNRGLHELHDSVDFSSAVAPDAALTAQFYTSKLPIYYIEVGVLRLKTSPIASSIADIYLQPHVRLSQTQFHYLSLPEDDSYSYPVTTVQDAIRVLENGRYSYFLSYWLAPDQYDNDKFQFDVLGHFPVHLVISKQHPNAQEWLDKINTTLAKQPPAAQH